MGFADGYLQKSALRKALPSDPPRDAVQLIICLPAYRESGLHRSLDSLFQCHGQVPAEVLILINAPESEPSSGKRENEVLADQARSWIRSHLHPTLNFHLGIDQGFPDRHAGVGLARKVLMDEALRRFSLLDRPGGILASLDADARVDPNYLTALVSHFHTPVGPASSATGEGSRPFLPEGASLYFEHPLSPEEDPGGPAYPAEVYRAIALYELHVRTYLWWVRSTGFPHAFHTVGSAFAVRADTYAAEGGMNRRQGGEDFYFIQKVARRGRFTACTETRVAPSPRPVGRVPFGTGPAVSRILAQPGNARLDSYHPQPFAHLRDLFAGIGHLRHAPLSSLRPGLHPVLAEFLRSQDGEAALEEIRRNSASDEMFRKRFWHWFHMFRVMKYLHFARERGFSDVPVEESARACLEEWSGRSTGNLPEDAGELLTEFRRMDRSPIPQSGTRPHPLFS
ncbi:MAG: hypothetical protein R2751_19300 [Bacteroidales bacterium]